MSNENLSTTFVTYLANSGNHYNLAMTKFLADYGKKIPPDTYHKIRTAGSEFSNQQFIIFSGNTAEILQNLTDFYNDNLIAILSSLATV